MKLMENNEKVKAYFLDRDLKDDKYAASANLQERAHASIPGGSHTYAKGDDQYPLNSPGFIERGKGCHVWDVDGNEFIEYGSGLRAVTLGHAFPSVVSAVRQQLELGSNFTRPHFLEVECAEKLLSFIPRAEMVKFAKDGSTVTTAAIKLARAVTGREMVAVCRHDPFLSYNDWFVGSTEMNRGVPESEMSLTTSFQYNDIESVHEMFAAHRGQISCVIMEAARTDEPEGDFLHELQDTCRAEGALFVLDEMITGFRWGLGGAQEVYGLDPDLSAFGKGMANGFSLSALVGKAKYMELAGLIHDQERVFLLSTTHGAETHSLAAAIATMEAYESLPVIDQLYHSGQRLRAGVEKKAQSLGLEEYFTVAGRDSNLVFGTNGMDGKPSQAFRTLFMQEIIARGVLAPSFVNCYSHSDEVVDTTIDVVGEALVTYRAALESGVDRYLIGHSVQPVFRKFN